jgi:hypothetical protein
MKKNRTISEDQIKNAVQSKVQRMEEELKRNPTNTVTAQRLATFKRIHASKLVS